MKRVFAGLSLLVFEVLSRLPWLHAAIEKLSLPYDSPWRVLLLAAAAVTLVALLMMNTDVRFRIGERVDGARLLGLGTALYLFAELAFIGIVASPVQDSKAIALLALVLSLGPPLLFIKLGAKLLLLLGALRFFMHLAPMRTRRAAREPVRLKQAEARS